eukprot:682627-Amorphochlora_amoeboformis.AAC.1
MATDPAAVFSDVIKGTITLILMGCVGLQIRANTDKIVTKARIHWNCLGGLLVAFLAFLGVSHRCESRSNMGVFILDGMTPRAGCIPVADGGFPVRPSQPLDHAGKS